MRWVFAGPINETALAALERCKEDGDDCELLSEVHRRFLQLDAWAPEYRTLCNACTCTCKRVREDRGWSCTELARGATTRYDTAARRGIVRPRAARRGARRGAARYVRVATFGGGAGRMMLYVRVACLCVSLVPRAAVVVLRAFSMRCIEDRALFARLSPRIQQPRPLETES